MHPGFGTLSTKRHAKYFMNDLLYRWNDKMIIVYIYRVKIIFIKINFICFFF